MVFEWVLDLVICIVLHLIICGTLLTTGASSELSSSTMTCCDLSLRNDFIHCRLVFVLVYHSAEAWKEDVCVEHGQMPTGLPSEPSELLTHSLTNCALDLTRYIKIANRI